MSTIRLKPENSFVMLIDVQEALRKAIYEMDRLVQRCAFLLRIANLMEIPVFATEQNPQRMGTTVSVLRELIPAPHPKMSFSGVGVDGCLERIRESGRTQAVLIGIETHICVTQTALDLLDGSFQVSVCPDAVSARSLERHKLGMERLRDSGVMPSHTEATAYEWLGSASHPKFREFLQIVKNAS